jgi:hypothetical protein
LSIEQVEDLRQKVAKLAKESLDTSRTTGCKPNISENASFQQLAKQQAELHHNKIVKD